MRRRREARASVPAARPRILPRILPRVLPRLLPRLLLALGAAGALLPVAACGGMAAGSTGVGRTLRIPIRSAGPGSLDPVRGSTTYDNQACSLVYETLLQYKYLKRPLELEPLLLAEMPRVSEDGLVYRCRLKEGVRFADDPCFPDGRGRELVARDVFYSLRRMADPANDPKSWWLFENTFVGFDEYRDAQRAAVDAGGTFDYDVPIEGFVELGDHEFELRLKQPVVRLLYVLAMFQTSVLPREAVEHYGRRLSRHPVGSGPFVLTDWVTSMSMSFVRNPSYHEDTYPTEWMPEDEEFGLHLAAGQPVPFVDRIEISMYVQDQPMWLEFRSGALDYAQIPDEFYSEAIHKRSGQLKRSYAEEGIRFAPTSLLDYIFRGFNLEDDVLGGYTEERCNLRRAMALATDFQEFNDTFYSSVNVVYDGPIPPGLDGYPEGGRDPRVYRGPDLERARALLAKAGFPGGKGLPPIDYYTSLGANSAEQTELTKRQLGAIGLQVNAILLEFPQLIEAINTKKAPFFSFAWGSDYPDAENNLALFYGPNESPGSNHYNYKNAEYDRLYEKILTMQPGPERTAIYHEMTGMLARDVPAIGSMARTRSYLITPRLKNCKPTEVFWNWTKYLDVADDVARP